MCFRQLHSCRPAHSGRAAGSMSLLVLLLLLLLAGCSQPAPAGTLPPTAEAAPTPTQTAVTPVESDATIPTDEAGEPVELVFPTLDETMPISPMGWDVVMKDDELTTEWVVPEDSLGWHITSAQPGTAGNVVISGHQALGAALLAPVALGDIIPGDEILLSDDVGRTFVYRVTEVSDPIPLDGAGEAELASMNEAVAPTETPRLTLLTGWPDFTTTHRIFVVAEYVGQAGGE